MANQIDIFWVVLAAMLVFVMQIGFLLLETGFTRSKNNINVAMKNIADFAVTTLLFWLFGYALMFGVTTSGLFGITEFMPELDVNRLDQAAFFIFQVMFCGTAVTIVAGAVAERVRFAGYMLISAIAAGIIYPIFGHWAWNGINLGMATGWLSSMGFVDFAGSSVVHSVGGWISLAIVLIVGPRIGRFDAQGKPQHIPASNLALATTGAMLLWFGWFGFNGGSSLAFNAVALRAFGNTVMAGSAGLVMGMFLGQLIYKRTNVDLLLNGTLAGLVGITANAHAVTLGQSVIIGALAAVVMYGGQMLLERLRIDDAVGAIPVHLCAGIWGTLAVGIFGDLQLLNTGLSRIDQIGVQILGIIVCAAWVFGTTMVIILVVNRITPLRVSPEDERVGLNVSEHNERTDLLDLIDAMQRQAETGDLSIRVPVEPFTEVGMFAQEYNHVMNNLEASQAEAERLREQELEARVAVENARLKSEFTSMITHELRTPLNSVVGYSGMMLMGVRGTIDEDARTMIQSVEDSGKHLLGLINDILDLDKLEAGQFTMHPAPVEMRRLVPEWMETMRVLADQKGLWLDAHFDAHFPTVMTTDSERITQIAFNLIANAIKFTDKGGVYMRLQTDATTWTLAVQDTGIGISAANQALIFDRFQQVEGFSQRQYKGTGLGLAIVKLLVEALGGQISVHSIIGEGSTFTAIFPLDSSAHLGRSHE